jgi:hypothetical protein
MKVYKYRGSDDRETFERDLSSIEKNNFWAPNFLNLNDPCETTISIDSLELQSKFFLPFLGTNSKEKFQPVINAVESILNDTKKIGVYSLSKTFNDELLWAHYANSHKGFCIEYDLDVLLTTYKSNNLYSFPVIYKKVPPSINIKDVLSAQKANSIIHKMAGYKSLRWKYEEEIRIITEEYGDQSYDFQAVKSIYFGLRMLEDQKTEIITRLEGRGINFYQIERIPKTYKFKRVLISNKFGNDITYLCQLPKTNKRSKIVKYQIIEKDFLKYKGKATITIQLESKVDCDELNTIARKIKSDIFGKAERIFIAYIFENDIKGQGYWATSKYEGDNLETSINGLTLEQEQLIIKRLKNETRNTIGMWIDDSPYIGSSLTLLQQNGEIILETFFHDGSKSSCKLISKQFSDKIRYDDFEPNIHGEYFEVGSNGILNYYSPNGVFRTLKPFEYK